MSEFQSDREYMSQAGVRGSLDILDELQFGLQLRNLERKPESAFPSTDSLHGLHIKAVKSQGGLP